MGFKRSALGAIAIVAILSARDEARGQLSPALRENKWGYVNAESRFVIQPEFDEAGPFAQGLAPVSSGGKYGYIDVRGAMKIGPRFEMAGAFSQGLAAVKLGGKYGYIDTLDKEAIIPQFAWAGPFRDGRAAFLSDGKFGYLNPQGERVIGAQFALARPFSEGLAAVSGDGERFGFIDVQGKGVIEPKFRLAGGFLEGLAWFQDRDGKYGFIDTTGRVAIPPTYTAVKPFHRGLAPAQVDGKWLLIDRRGEPRTEAAFDGFTVKPNGTMAAVRGGGSFVVRADAGGNVSLANVPPDPDSVEVEFASGGAALVVYRPFWLDYLGLRDSQPADKDLGGLQTAGNLVGNTDVADTLNALSAYAIMFVDQNHKLISVRRFVPQRGVRRTLKP